MFVSFYPSRFSSKIEIELTGSQISFLLANHFFINYAYPVANGSPLDPAGGHPQYEHVEQVAHPDAQDEEGHDHQGQDGVRESTIHKR